METKTLHFTVGEEMGIRLAEIAQEHFIYNNDINKAFNTFYNSFGGECPKELILRLLTGESIIIVNTEQQEFIVVDRADYIHLDKMYPKLDFVNYFDKKEKEMRKTLLELRDTLDMVISKFKYRSKYKVEFSINAIVNYIYGDDDVMIEEINDDYELDSMRTLIEITKKFIEKSFHLSKLVKEVNCLYDLNIDFDTHDLLLLSEKIRKFKSVDFDMGTSGADEMLSNYIEATKEIDNTISKGIEPVDIMENWSAGWLSPEGDYYALNGEIANMLHIQIGDALQEKGIIPMYANDRDKEIDNKINPDSWLEQQGWVKIHGNNINFGGNLNEKINKHNVQMTDKQLEIISDYITDCYQCEIRVGWRQERQSIGRFMFDSINREVMNKKYFDF
jgi:hypothetical protein